MSRYHREFTVCVDFPILEKAQLVTSGCFYFLRLLFEKLKYSWFTIVLISAIQQSDSVIHVCVCICIYIHIHTHTYLYILFHYGLSQDIKYSSLVV